MATWIWITACLVVACISFVFGGVYFSARAAASEPPPPTERVQSLMTLACRGGAFVATEDGGDTMVVVTMERNRVCRVRLYTPGAHGTDPGMWQDVGHAVVSHVVGGD
jgi:uncharacterized protein YneF (UPF0154 family)